MCLCVRERGGRGEKVCDCVCGGLRGSVTVFVGGVRGSVTVFGSLIFSTVFQLCNSFT